MSGWRSRDGELWRVGRVTHLEPVVFGVQPQHLVPLLEQVDLHVADGLLQPRQLGVPGRQPRLQLVRRVHLRPVPAGPPSVRRAGRPETSCTAAGKLATRLWSSHRRAILTSGWMLLRKKRKQLQNLSCASLTRAVAGAVENNLT